MAKKIQLPTIVCADIVSEPISVAQLADMVRGVSGSAAGSVISFSGDVRDSDAGRSVCRLDYEAHPDAADVLGRIVYHVVSTNPEVLAVGVQHRVGMLDLGDTALAVVVASMHRSEGFMVCTELINQIKTQLPVWKRQIFPDGSDEWVGCP